jgi:glycosyltransferase involved in cell wall biosynthesis
MAVPGRIGAVLIGRNEGERLVRALAAAGPQVDCMVYVDSGSTDSSVAVAENTGAVIVQLDMAQPFTAARARNTGLSRLLEDGHFDFVQFTDGDCELQPGWIDTARAFLEAMPQAAVVHGRRRERFPEATHLQLVVRLGMGPAGRGRRESCGGDALMRVAALQAGRRVQPNIDRRRGARDVRASAPAGWQIWCLSTMR